MERGMPAGGLRVLVVGKGAPERGGIPTFLESLLERLPAHGVRAELLNLAEEGGREGGALSVGNLAATARDVARTARAAGDADVVHVHSACAPAPTLVRAGALCAAARARGARTVLHVHGGLIADWLRGGRREALVRQSLRGADLVVAVAAGPAAVLTQALGREVPVIPNGVDLDRFRPPERARGDEGDPVVLVVGGLTRRKGSLDVLAASASLVARGVRHRLVLAGGTPDDGTAAVEEVMDALRRGGDHVTVAPPVPNASMPERYQAADVFCLPSWWEAQPLSLLEAMAAGLPSVATDVGDVRAMTADGSVAAIVPPRDPAALEEALATVLADAEGRRATGLAARAHVAATRDIGAVVDAVVDAYRLVMAHRTHRPHRRR